MFDFLAGGRRTRFVRARTWADGQNFKYPETELKSLSDKSDLGVAFSGGGTRSASAVTGQLRGLKKLGLLNRIKYVSAVSGGSWGSGPFTFLPDRFDEDEFLGEHLEPKDITIESLKRIPGKSLLAAVSDSVITDDFFTEAAKLGGDETYSRAIGNIFLRRFDLDHDDRFMSLDERTLADVLERNSKEGDPDHFLKKGDFQLPRKGRPFFIAGATLFSGQRKAPRIHAEFTPYYSGTRNFFNLSDPVGGGYVETVGCDSKKPRRAGSNVKVKLGGKRHRFAISDMIGTSGAAPQELLRKVNVDFLGFPEFRHWAMKPGGGYSEDEELSYGDGGHIENLGIMPLLARKVKNIIVFANSKTRFKYNEDNPLKSRIATSIPNLFKTAEDGFRMNLVIKDDGQHTKYLELLEAFRDADLAGTTLIHADTYDIRSNKHYSVKAYSGVWICWVYNQDVRKWREQLPFQTDKMIRDGEVERFPHYRTFFQNPPKIIDLTRAEAGLLAHLSCWNVTHNEGRLVGF